MHEVRYYSSFLVHCVPVVRGRRKLVFICRRAEEGLRERFSCGRGGDGEEWGNDGGDSSGGGRGG